MNSSDGKNKIHVVRNVDSFLADKSDVLLPRLFCSVTKKLKNKESPNNEKGQKKKKLLHINITTI
jgi:hypothetical protein